MRINDTFKHLERVFRDYNVDIREFLLQSILCDFATGYGLLGITLERIKYKFRKQIVHFRKDFTDPNYRAQFFSLKPFPARGGRYKFRDFKTTPWEDRGLRFGRWTKGTKGVLDQAAKDAGEWNGYLATRYLAAADDIQAARGKGKARPKRWSNIMSGRNSMRNVNKMRRMKKGYVFNRKQCKMAVNVSYAERAFRSVKWSTVINRGMREGVRNYINHMERKMKKEIKL